MRYSIPSSTKVFTLATAPLLFMLVGIQSVNLLWCQECTFYCPLRKKRRGALFHEGTDAHIHEHIHQQDLKLCLPLYYYSKVIVELEKTHTSNLTIFMVLVT